eukprot:gene20270-10723_t
MERLMWELWMETCLGVSSVHRWRDGVEEWMRAVLDTVQRTQFASGRAAARVLGCDPSRAEYQLPLTEHQQKQSSNISRVRALSRRQVAGEGEAGWRSDVLRWCGRTDAGWAAIAAACAVRSIAADAPGEYVTVRGEGVIVTEAVSIKSDEIETLPVGRKVQVLEVSRCDDVQRIRGRIAEPAGWISLSPPVTVDPDDIELCAGDDDPDEGSAPPGQPRQPAAAFDFLPPTA